MILLLMQLFISVDAQPLPITIDTSIQVNHLMNVKRYAVRITKNPVDGALYYITYNGNVYKILKNGITYSDSLVASAANHYINYLQGIVFRDSAMYLVGNRKVANSAGYGLVVRGKFKPDNSWFWDTIMRTSNYQSTATLYDHAFSSICISSSGDSLIIGSGSRTDHGEIETSNGLFPNTRDVALTGIIFKIPINPAATIFLPNDSALLAATPYVFCRGNRNSFDIAIAPNNDVIATENSGDRDDSEELNWLQKDGHYGFPWRMGGNNTPMQFAGYIPGNDVLINHNCSAWGNGSTTNKFYNDPTYPQVPVGLTFMEPIKNYGPDADKFRDPNTGSVRDASNEGSFITSFTAHRSPLGLVFDQAGKLLPPYYKTAFMLSYTKGTIDTTGTISSGITGPFSELGQDLMQLALFKDTLNNQYSMNCFKIASGFNQPVDAYIDDNKLYVIESHTPNDTVPPKLFMLSFATISNSNSVSILGNDTAICIGNSISLQANLKGKYYYLWSTGATTAQISVTPAGNTNYWLRVNNGIIEITDTINVNVATNPQMPSNINLSGGTAKVCPGDNRTYTVSFLSGLSYNWTVPNGAIINSGQGTRSINVSYTSGFIASGTITVSTTNTCATSAARSVSVIRNIPARPGVITGDIFDLCGKISKAYFVPSISGLSYNWLVPSTATINSGQGTNSIDVSFPPSNFTGVISVAAVNACGSGLSRTLTVRAINAAPSIINGPISVCQNSNGNAYNISSILSAVNYTWTGPSGSHITGNGITSTNNVLTTIATNVTVSYGALTSTSTLKVRANNTCGGGSTKSLTLIPCVPRIGVSNLNQEIGIYPNPSDGLFIIQLSVKELTQHQIYVYDLLGKERFSTTFFADASKKEYFLDLNSLNPGIYILSVHNSTTERNFKIIKE